MTKNHPSKNQRETWTDGLSKDNDTQVTNKHRERCLMGNKSPGETRRSTVRHLPARAWGKQAGVPAMLQPQGSAGAPRDTGFFPKRTPRRCERPWRLFFF